MPDLFAFFLAACLVHVNVSTAPAAGTLHFVITSPADPETFEFVF